MVQVQHPGRHRPAEGVALEQLGAEGSAAIHLLQGLHSLGQHQGADASAEAGQALHRLLLEEIPIQAGDQAAVQLDDVGPQLGDAGQVAVARTQVVQGDQEAMAALLIHEAGQGLVVAHLTLIDLDHHVLGVHAGGAGGPQKGPRSHHAGGDHRGLDVEEQQRLGREASRGTQRGVTLQGPLAAEAIQLQQAASLAGRGEGLTDVHGPRAGQGFQPDDPLLLEGENRLEMNIKGPTAQHPLQRTEVHRGHRDVGAGEQSHLAQVEPGFR